MKKSITFFFILSILSACKFELPADKTLKTCQMPTSITATADVSNPLKSFYVLAGNTTDIASVTWKTANGSTILNQASLAPTASYVYAVSVAGNYTTTADITTLCGDKKTLTYNATVQCVAPSSITTAIDAMDKRKYTFSLATTKASDVKAVVWKVLSGTDIVIQSTLSVGQTFTYTAPIGGLYTVTADIQTICNDNISLKTTMTVNVLSLFKKVTVFGWNGGIGVYNTYLIYDDATGMVKKVSARTGRTSGNSHTYTYNNDTVIDSSSTESGSSSLQVKTYTILKNAKGYVQNDGQISYEYDTNGFITKTIDKSFNSNYEGVVTIYENDGKNYTKLIDAQGNQTTFEYYTDKQNTILQTPMEYSFISYFYKLGFSFGRININPIKKIVGSTSTTNHTYSYDTNGYIVGQDVVTTYPPDSYPYYRNYYYTY